MTRWIAALPMYDWPERRGEVDAQWAAIRDRLRTAGIDAPEELTRDFGDLHELWRRPNLLFAQTCWGPMGLGLAEHVQVIGQQSYDGIEGGQGEFYSSAIVLRSEMSGRTGGTTERQPSSPIPASIPLDLLRSARFAYNSDDSMSGLIGLTRDLEAIGESLDVLSERIISGGHRNSIRMVASGEADMAAIDCLSWHLARQYEPAAADVQIVGWTSRRKGLPFITAKNTPPAVVAALQEALNGWLSRLRST